MRGLISFVKTALTSAKPSAKSFGNTLALPSWVCDSSDGSIGLIRDTKSCTRRLWAAFIFLEESGQVQLRSTELLSCFI
ncbi:hypothetical protein LZ023_18380 [Pseudomonas silvicola]|nr:hypothetical protein LZ023_18380 [Pseudomonas silvicola]